MFNSNKAPDSTSGVLHLPQQLLDLFNQTRQVGFSERKVERRDAVVFDVRRDMFVVRVGRGESRIIRVRLRIVPI